MAQLILPYYKEGFILDFTKTAPFDKDDLEMHITPRMKFVFRDIWSPGARSSFSIGYVLENDKFFDCKDFKMRMKEFERFKDARVKRAFNNSRNSIFFDEEEIELLSRMFDEEQFTAIVEIWFDNKKVAVESMPKKMFKVVKPYLDSYGIVYPAKVEELRVMKSIKYDEKGVLKMNDDVAAEEGKKNGRFKMVSGVAISIASVASFYLATTMISDGYKITKSNDISRGR